MTGLGQADTFTILNGPEDGTEFPIVRAPFYIGSDSACSVHIRLDSGVHPTNALVTAVSAGYRVRRTDRTPVYVDGKRTGVLRSRIVRSGGTVQVGHTLIQVECTSEGLAHRSTGIVAESDFGWAVQELGRGLLIGTVRFVRGLLRIFGRLLTSWLALFAIFILLYLFWPWMHDHVNDAVFRIYYRIIGALLNR